jgi:hypothetical protein
MNLLHLPEKYQISILYGDEDTCILEEGWEVLSDYNIRGSKVVGFDHEAAVRRNLPIVSAITAVDLQMEYHCNKLLMKSYTVMHIIIHACQNSS